MMENLSIGGFWNDGCCMHHGTRNLIVDLNHKMAIGSATLLYHREKMVGFVGNVHIMIIFLQVMFSVVSFCWDFKQRVAKIGEGGNISGSFPLTSCTEL